MKYLIIVVVIFFIACSDENTDKNPLEPEPMYSSINVAESSSSQTAESSSGGKTDESSSSQTAESSSSGKTDESSSSLAVESSSSVVEENSSSSLVFTGACKTATEDNCVYGTLYDDRDGKTYKTVKIGDQEWMAENLNYEITGINKTTIWSICYKNSADSCTKYGRFYTWTAAIDSISVFKNLSLECGSGKVCLTLENEKIQGICPNGWHLPSQGEWKVLSEFIGSTNAGALLKSMWENWNGIDSFGFSVIPSGYVYNASNNYMNQRAYFWTSSDKDNYFAKCVVFYYNGDAIVLDSYYKGPVAAATVRCIKD
jgi:uncharacterized protein (TIGR02145 family)